ncbi:MAG: hypothetical protein ABI369_09695, partial [Acetobacteraceae bacterium]
DLPQPFRGNPGDVARRLAASPPVPPRLIVPAPGTALLSDDGSKALAALLARDLQMREVPAYAEAGNRSDWVLAVTARHQGEAIVPVYTVRTPQGHDAGSLQGPPVPLAAWAMGTPATLEQVASDAAPRLTAMLARLNTTLQQADPNSLLNRAARVAVPDVTGAPGDGDTALTRLMRVHLGALGVAVQDRSKGADFVVQGRVRVVPIGGGQERVEIQWIVTSPSGGPSGGERGRVVQLNDVPTGSLSRAWADVAEAVTEQASGGIREVVLRQSGREPDGQPTKAAVMDTSPKRR